MAPFRWASHINTASTEPNTGTKIATTTVATACEVGRCRANKQLTMIPNTHNNRIATSGRVNDIRHPSKRPSLKNHTIAINLQPLSSGRRTPNEPIQDPIGLAGSLPK